MRDPYAVDFAALRTLRMVHALGSFSRAAERLDVTQSTVSYAIERLRAAFGDPLFVREGARMVPTERCTEVVARVSRMIDDFVALAEPSSGDTFDPGAARGSVTISCNYYEMVSLMPAVMRRLRTRAPGVTVTMLSSTVRGKAQLDRGESDLLIGPVKVEDPGFFRRALLQDHYVCVMAPGHPLAGRDLDLATYLRTPHATVNYGSTWRSSYRVALERLGEDLNTVITVPSPATLPALLAGTDMISTVPRRTAQAYGAAVATAGCPVPAPFGIDLYWTARTHTGRLQHWLRTQIAEVAAALP